jgi:multicomponent Na+:H+ antiporter subunit G
MSMTEFLTLLLLIAGAFFYIAGTVGLLRFPDIYSRLHALTKADNLGLGLIIVGLALQADSLTVICKHNLIWLLVQLASASVAHMVARSAQQKGIKPWTR